MSKFPEIRGLAYCTRVARAQCIITPLVMHQRIALVELYQYANFASQAQSFPKVKVPMHVHYVHSVYYECLPGPVYPQ